MFSFSPKTFNRCLGLSLAGLMTATGWASQPAAAQTDSPFCESQETSSDVAQGRSYGDPHINTLDGFHYVFPTVGEFILAHSRDRNFEVQTRQAAVPNRSNLSLNTAVAMRVCDQRVAFYVQDSPDGSNTLVWVDGQPVQVGEAFALENGGEIQRQDDRHYTVIWPSGDQVAIKEITVSGSRFLNIMPIVSRAHMNQMAGLLGNFNGNPDDDLTSRGGATMPARSTYSIASNTLSRALPAAIPVAEIETAYFEQLNQQFGDSWRINQAESLFDYPIGMTTANFTNRNFPEQFLTLNGVSDADLEAAIAVCEAAGVSEDMMDGCVFDVAATGNNGFANAAANAVTAVVLERATNRVINEIERNIPIPGGFGFPF
ncbi:MAG: VWD domain-containing protein [Cyanobacteria bacterium J06632_3]